jgi:hypothetical protein
LSRSDPVDLTLLISFGCLLCLELWFREIYGEVFSNAFLQNHVSHVIHTEKHVVQQYIEPYPHTQQ